MDGWLDCSLDGWMDGRMAGLKNKHKENSFFYRIFRNFSHTFWRLLLSRIITVVLNMFH